MIMIYRCFLEFLLHCFEGEGLEICVCVCVLCRCLIRIIMSVEWFVVIEGHGMIAVQRFL